MTKVKDNIYAMKRGKIFSPKRVDDVARQNEHQIQKNSDLIMKDPIMVEDLMIL